MSGSGAAVASLVCGEGIAQQAELRAQLIEDCMQAIRAHAPAALTHPDLSPIQGFHWTSISEDQMPDGVSRTRLLMAPGEHAALLTQ
jgi:hypothetical protein